MKGDKRNLKKLWILTLKVAITFFIGVIIGYLLGVRETIFYLNSDTGIITLCNLLVN